MGGNLQPNNFLTEFDLVRIDFHDLGKYFPSPRDSKLTCDDLFP